MAGCAAMLEIDIKKVIALSTLSQLGIIIIIIGAGAPILAYFHLLSHAFFKAILFICAGMIIHNIKDYQDIRKIGLTTIFILIILIILVGTFLTVAYSCRMRFLLGLNLVKSERCFYAYWHNIIISCINLWGNKIVMEYFFI